MAYALGYVDKEKEKGSGRRPPGYVASLSMVGLLGGALFTGVKLVLG